MSDLIEVKIGNNKYSTARLLFEDLLNLGTTVEEKIFPFFTCFGVCIANGVSDDEILKALYTSCKDVFKKEDLKFISDLVLNKDALLVNGKKLDEVEFNKHWQAVGYVEYRVLTTKLIKENLGNFTSLQQLLPTDAVEEFKRKAESKLLMMLTKLNLALEK